MKSNNIEKCQRENGFESLEQCKQFCLEKGIDVEKIVRGIQPIAFDNAVNALALGVAIALKQKSSCPETVAKTIGVGLQAFCTIGSVADERKIGIGHGNLAAMLLNEENECFCFLAGHESFAAAEGAMGIAKSANLIRTKPLKVILVGLGKDAAYIIARINGFTYVQTAFENGNLAVVAEKPFSSDLKKNVLVFGCDSVMEGVEIMKMQKVNISITGNSTNPTRFQHPVAGIFAKHCHETGFPFFSVASGGGTGRTLHPDNVAAGPASYGLTDTMGRMHCNAQFAGSSSVPAHVEMMGFVGIGNNPLVGAVVSLAVATSLANRK